MVGHIFRIENGLIERFDIQGSYYPARLGLRVFGDSAAACGGEGNPETSPNVQVADQPLGRHRSRRNARHSTAMSGSASEVTTSHVVFEGGAYSSVSPSYQPRPAAHGEVQDDAV